MAKPETDPHLVIPPVPPLHVARPRLLSRLDSATDTPLILLSAGPGAGKTVLLSDWARNHRDTVAWMTVRSGDNDPARFWRLFARAVHGSASSLPPADTHELFESVLPSDASTVLLIDDAHVLTHPHILDGLDTIVRGWYPQLRLVLAARSD